MYHLAKKIIPFHAQAIKKKYILKQTYQKEGNYGKQIRRNPNRKEP